MAIKGVILAGGNGTRLQPLTLIINKHLLPVYKKPMIYYPIETLVNAGIKDILIITSGECLGQFYKLIKTGEDWGVHIRYEIQSESAGTGNAILCAEHFVGEDDFVVILGDNIISGDINRFKNKFVNRQTSCKALISVTKSDKPKDYGVISYDGDTVKSFDEKPQNPQSNYVATGIWAFTSEVFAHLKKVKKSIRNEYEITDVFQQYIKEESLKCDVLDELWTDAGTFEQLYKAAVIIKALEDDKANSEDFCDLRQGGIQR
jgi:glucose-1-phosphate thymidylyltransferase